MHQGHQKTLGGRLLLFGSQKINSILQRLPRSIRGNTKAWRMNIPGKESVHARDGKQPLVHARVPVEPYESGGSRVNEFILDRGTNDKSVDRGRQYQQHHENVSSRGLGKTEIRCNGIPLPQQVRDLFSGLFRRRLPSVTVRQGAASDAFLKRNRADAMTIGTDIYFKTGMFDPVGKRGLGLLGHELIHAEQNSGNRGGAAGVRSRELNEKNALAHERLVLEHAPFPNAGYAGLRCTNGASPAKTHEASHTGVPAQTQSPQFADSSRQVEPTALTASGAAKPGVLSDRDMQRIKEEVYRDLLMRIKIDFERGA